jgi:hypothetical protein
MPGDDEIRLRPGRLRSRGGANTQRLVGQELRSAEKAGGITSRASSSSRSSSFGRGRSASLRASRGRHARTRLVTVKARVVRHGERAAPLVTHVAYLQRDGVTKDGAAGRLFDRDRDNVDGRGFADRCIDDRHHFRFIVSPEDAVGMADLKAFTRDLMTNAEQDLGTRLDWVAGLTWKSGAVWKHRSMPSAGRRSTAIFLAGQPARTARSISGRIPWSGLMQLTTLGWAGCRSWSGWDWRRRWGRRSGS